MWPPERLPRNSLPKRASYGKCDSNCAVRISTSRLRRQVYRVKCLLPRLKRQAYFTLDAPCVTFPRERHVTSVDVGTHVPVPVISHEASTQKSLSVRNTQTPTFCETRPWVYVTFFLSQMLVSFVLQGAFCATCLLPRHLN